MSISDVPVGNNAPNEVNVIIEIQRGNKNKYEVDKDTGVLFLDRVNATALAYPVDYGYVPQTLCEDGDPLDALIVIDESIPHGAALSARPIGVLYMIDDGEKDEKLICVAVEDVTMSQVTKLEDLGPNFKPMIEHFFANYKAWKKDWQGIPVSFDGWGDADAAKTVIKESIELYKK